MTSDRGQVTRVKNTQHIFSFLFGIRTRQEIQCLHYAGLSGSLSRVVLKYIRILQWHVWLKVSENLKWVIKTEIFCIGVELHWIGSPTNRAN